VKPYQPPGLWRDLAGESYQPDPGEGLYRRSLYTFWKRTIPPPAMMTFDAAGRETCVVRESRTNTPLQALNLMNDVAFVEASRKLAERMLNGGGLARGFQAVTGRAVRPPEIAVLERLLERYRADYQRDPDAAAKLVAQGKSERMKGRDAELAAYTAVASLLLNLDEAVTKE
jgi:hypothetical protein